MQSYENHAHRPKVWMVGILCWVAAGVGFVGQVRGRPWGAVVLLAGLLAATGVLLFVARRYATRLQDRIILLEMQVRGQAVLTPAQQGQLRTLATNKVVALRFASDAELPALLDRAVADQLSPNAIKRAVTQWRADRLRT